MALEYITIPLSPSGGGSGGLTETKADTLYLSKKANKLTALPSKTPIHQDDILLIEDSQDSNKKKKIKVSDLKTDLDDSEVWKPSIAYTSDNIFSFKTTNTTAAFKNGEKIEANKVYLARYDSNATSSTALTNSEMAKFVRINHDDAITAIWDKDKDTGIEFERTTDNDTIHITTNGNDRLIINKDGKVGVGTIASLAQLEVRTNNNQGIIIQSGNGAGTATRTQLGFGWQETNNYQHRILTEHNSSASNGNKIIFKLWNYGVDTATTLGSLQVMTIVGNGRVGIMTSEPTQRLDVNGNARLRSGLYDGDNGKGANGQVLSSTGNKTKWVSLHKNITVHNASATVALKSVNHLGCEAHVESTNNYTINGSDWNDGDEFNIINTTGSIVACNLVVSGFTGAYLRDGSTTNITSLNIGEQDASFLVRVTENPLNSGTKYLNVTRLNRFQVSKKELSSYIMVSDDKNIDDKKLVINTSGTAPTYQIKSGGTLQNLSTAVLGNGKIDDDIKSIAIYVNGLKIPRGRYTKDSAEQVTVDVSNVISGNWISKDTEIEIVR